MSEHSNGIQFEYTTNRLDCYIKQYTLLYANDTILISDFPNDIQAILDALHIYCQKCKLKVNASKTKIVVFSKSLIRKPLTWKFGDKIIEVVSDYLYLSIIYNFNGKFMKAINKQVLQVKRASYSMIAKARFLQLPINIQLHLLDTCDLPILLYG